MKRREGAVSFGELLGEAKASPPPQAVAPVMEAMKAAEVTDMDNKRVFSSVMLGRDSRHLGGSSRRDTNH